MLKTAVLILSFFSVSVAQAYTCSGIYEYLNEKDSLVQEKGELTLNMEIPKQKMMSTDVGPYHYYLLENKKTGEFLFSISLGPDYVDGVTASFTWDQKSDFRIARVDGNTVYKLVCKK